MSQKPLHSETHLDLAQQVVHNLRHQHLWKDVDIHVASPISPSDTLPRPLISGLPPNRLYVHPDEQIDLLEQSKRKEKGSSADGTPGSGGFSLLSAKLTREWVLPARMNETWTLRKLARVFDSISLKPPEPESVEKMPSFDNEDAGGASVDRAWDQTKRVLMAIVDGDSTIVYYIVHDGIVKPRQN